MKCIVATKDFSAADWKKLLNDFADKVVAFAYKRVEYKRWCCLKPVEQTIKVCLNRRDDYLPSIDIYNGITVTRVMVQDGSFGDFLFFNIFNKEEQNMAYNIINDKANASALELKVDYCNKTTTTASASINNAITAIENLKNKAFSTTISCDLYPKVEYGELVENTLNSSGQSGTSNQFNVDPSTIPTFNDVEKMITDKINENDKKKENDEMKNIVNFDFGPCTGSENIRMSVYGIAVKNANGTFVSYDATNMAIMDVDVFNFDGAKFLYKMPVAIKDIKVGDVVIHARKPMFVTDIVVKDKSLKVVDPVSGEKKEIILTRSPFGFDFATKIVNCLGNIGGNSVATADNPFGNLWMFMLMNDNGDTDNILPFMLMNQNGGNIDPMMMFALMSNKSNSSWLPFLMMTNANKPYTCSCNGHCGGTESN